MAAKAINAFVITEEGLELDASSSEDGRASAFEASVGAAGGARRPETTRQVGAGDRAHPLQALDLGASGGSGGRDRGSGPDRLSDPRRRRFPPPSFLRTAAAVVAGLAVVAVVTGLMSGARRTATPTSQPDVSGGPVAVRGDGPADARGRQPSRPAERRRRRGARRLASHQHHSQAAEPVIPSSPTVSAPSVATGTPAPPSEAPRESTESFGFEVG